MSTWTLDDISWDRFDPAKVDPEFLRLVKAAALVEYNGEEYARYLNEVFRGDDTFRRAADIWATEEVQHGRALGRWAEMADPAFDFDAAFRDFTAGFKLPQDVGQSVRGSRAGELIARCIVEVGTNSYYSALAEAATEPVIKEICGRIADDEERHYSLFFSHMKRYLKFERLPLRQRVRVAAGRILESGDDELSYAYHAANLSGSVYDRRRANDEYVRRAYPLYGRHHVDKGFAMIFRAIGLEPGFWSRLLALVARGFMRWRVAHLARAAG